MSVSNLSPSLNVNLSKVDINEPRNRIKVNLQSDVKFLSVDDPIEAAAALEESKRMQIQYDHINSVVSANSYSKSQKIDAIIYQNGKELIKIYEGGSISMPNSFQGKLGIESMKSSGFYNEKTTTDQKISMILKKIGIKSYEVGVYDFSKNPNGPTENDSFSVHTEEGLKDFLKNPSKKSTLPNPGLGGRLAGFTGIEVMERSQMLDRVKTAG